MRQDTQYFKQCMDNWNSITITSCGSTGMRRSVQPAHASKALHLYRHFHFNVPCQQICNDHFKVSSFSKSQRWHHSIPYIYTYIHYYSLVIRGSALGCHHLRLFPSLWEQTEAFSAVFVKCYPPDSNRFP